MFHMRLLSPTDQKCVKSSTYWQFFYYRPPGKLRWFTHLWEIVKKSHTHTYIYDVLDNWYGFSISDWLHHVSQFLVMKYLKRKLFFLNFQKLAGLWMCDWFAKWIIMLRFMDLGWPRVFQRSNVSLVFHVSLLACHFPHLDPDNAWLK